MKNGFDINRISNDGYLILPLSMSRLGGGLGQDPNQCYEILKFFGTKFESLSNDAVIVYTTGLYLNSDSVAYKLREKLHKQTIQHARELQNLISSKKEFMPAAIHFLPIDYIILNSNYGDFFTTLKNKLDIDAGFKEAVEADIKNFEVNEANINFVLEELVVTHVLREKMVDLPRTLVKNDVWRLIVYPGDAITSDRYQYQHNFLPKLGDNPYHSGVYNYKTKQYINFDT